MELRTVVFVLQEKWMEQARELERRLSGFGVACAYACRRVPGEMPGFGAWDPGISRDSALEGRVRASDTVVVTDDRALAPQLASAGIVCIGCDDGEPAFFEGAMLVTDDLLALGAALLEECLLRAQGRPVMIARTGRLVLREIAEQDFDALIAMSKEPEMEEAADEAGREFFTRERLAFYIRYAYPFYGYGLWSVLLHDGTLIGCCGLSERAYEPDAPTGAEHMAPDAAPCRLELQYALMRQYRRRGYGMEMCEAVLAFVRERTSWEEIWLSIRPQNHASVRLAQKLGFTRQGCGADGTLQYFLSLQRAQARPEANPAAQGGEKKGNTGEI